MKRATLVGIAAVCTLLLMMATSARAHHSIASEFDLFKATDITGTLTKVEWINPHGYLYMDVKGEDGNIVHWALEAPPPNGWRRVGVATRDYLPVGQSYTVRVAPAKNGTNTGLVLVITMPDGKKISVLGAQQTGGANN
jgi:hypothetical protein